eukprot:CAMPEP_0171170656 /NCGR_PEP_ID=MMETSP0790-20130122/8822_1 /TAXON_ID=2925 /ORGANISM="Alexandrium catenella, Strain OF101" /LENGTH=109 /DNA_ID=CAMNT_0011635501 /DNA_START=186 /DNA_END=515 /DNA_ORIENTATION=-
MHGHANGLTAEGNTNKTGEASTDASPRSRKGKPAFKVGDAKVAERQTLAQYSGLPSSGLASSTSSGTHIGCGKTQVGNQPGRLQQQSQQQEESSSFGLHLPLPFSLEPR